jgi:hypothetical protein
MHYIRMMNNHWNDFNAVYRVVEYCTSGISSIGIYKLLTSDNQVFERELSDEDVHWMETKDW